MRKNMGKHLVVWVRLKTVKRVMLSLCLLAMFVAVVSYEMPSAKTSGYWSLPLAGKVIAIDAGHGGPDGGAVSRQGVIEKDINLSIALYVRDYLQQAGALVVMTREIDKDLADEGTRGYSRRKTEDLKQRVRQIEDKQADLFISIHMNSVPSNRWSGAQVFYTPNHPDNEGLANLLQAEMIRNLENTDRIAKTVSTVYLLQALKIPSALVEVGFLSHPEEARLLAEETYQRKVAASIYNGILRYASGERPKS
ncbi:N-acetylmuramoyl-L-alanine amidase CwlD [Paenibacillus polysaccharolyticus]|uniref:N-acetylmuramoyl-L-alanine amidase n=3 Tax=Paenibacillus TaxID=44249 RepID=A0A1G5LG45_9BACL|nr:MULTISPECIES: N-acetylmuramoyl-L-alanine amidase CwlD [Paenibacillus]MBY0202017.1 N-acetylmuramoyl-L-alanine amidase CwlD [Paenibacillus cucumis (ex Kampfer et al. 2016)]MCP1131765.1 N-acetylmuramoyl-L-alanine amidase CwlD [Paenibacillus polysaccharolyticus]SCZ11893.1 N-acetylmuramoyl-L-alanine amidase [Paenibacillus polysaccharolyticus]